jgi:hypothetical protein
VVILAFLPEILSLGFILLLVGIALVAIGIAIYFGAEHPRETAIVACAVALCALAGYWEEVKKKWRAFRWQTLDRETRALILLFVLTPLIFAGAVAVLKVLDLWY